MNSFEIAEFIVFLCASILYIYHLTNNKYFIPNPLGFGIWLLADAANLFTYLDFSKFWVGPVIMVLGVLIVVVIGIVRTVISKNKISYKLAILDWFTIILVTSSIVFWIITNNAVLSNLAIQIVLAMGFIPIIKELIVEKKIEPLLPWTLFSIGFLIVLIHTLNYYERWEELFYPVIGLFGDLTVLILSGYNKVIESIS